ncbi:MarR family winged helix-turn-helix transcriptional regulator [Rathayibacter sp. ZW T2_19]|uniref:MarR family winged helix-turn-helix transcriptional regulator n=1 Tax=Rathayibacter rubneri TaxID=2950106 RepID=A0A9X2E558_9MICO|nr:MarR family winged helix-turn-helix transcriptional regulator [Rathayibacter rubneri]MCM6764509.1 MarR family winged helix-turn-helix transcriptional regulator [Rathayibacter rubneri]
MADHEVPPESPFALLSEAEAGVWYAYMKVHLRLRYELHQQLRRDSGIALADYDVLVALTSEPERRMSVADLAARIGWERSRLSHRVRGLRERGLVETRPGATDLRSTEVVLSEAGRSALLEAAPGHIAFVRAAFLDALDPEQKAAMQSALEGVYDGLIEHGTLPRPADHP